MTTFEDRESAFENKFMHDEGLRFRAEARCNRLLGLWAAEILGKTGTEADAYAASVVKADLEEAGHEDVLRKVNADLEGHVDPATVRAKRGEFLLVAQAQVLSES
ncbi:DUF1476 domain-containing protein [Salipiger marinus]|uniref:DUF1476 domain-containing protein n=1 Tax=Salipiger marinus TaxID=555512 RepID=A0A1G8TMB3_9RHOB|nr:MULTISPECIES: DUF1476 domain-containing protein [Salipiger]HBM58274.1 DUF1476 domain-containing protein [Citreicella sp.]MCD1619522.1 DUF1476 domain-containing protein [Salipiger manganoxidans]MEB3420356.1 DUF1476 domain-containing protein [Salipiger manganoxidans]SDJ42689.1 hypothetical protein SAMN04487993_10318 [Salipiger marinus]HBT02781.1 DUF1476 domain-containing protein [Citreicella sp.]